MHRYLDVSFEKQTELMNVCNKYINSVLVRSIGEVKTWVSSRDLFLKVFHKIIDIYVTNANFHWLAMYNDYIINWQIEFAKCLLTDHNIDIIANNSGDKISRKFKRSNYVLSDLITNNDPDCIVYKGVNCGIKVEIDVFKEITP